MFDGLNNMEEKIFKAYINASFIDKQQDRKLM